MRPTRNLGMLLLGIWLILSGAVPLFHIVIPYIMTILYILAIVAGVLILLGR